MIGHGGIEQVTADGSYDAASTNQSVTARDARIRTVMLSLATAVLNDEAGSALVQQDRHISVIETKWQLEPWKATSYVHRSLVEATIDRYKQIVDPQLQAKPYAGRRTEAAIGVAVLEAGRPSSVRFSKKAA